MSRLLVCGCPRHMDGHPIHCVRLPMRADHFAHWLKTYRCDHEAKPAMSSKPAERCDMAIMVLGIDETETPC